MITNRNRAGRGRAVPILVAWLSSLAVAASALESPTPPISTEAADGRASTWTEMAEDTDAQETRDSRPLEPRYQPRKPKGWYHTDYFFGISRSLSDSTLVPLVKIPLFAVTVPLDIACLPFAAIGGFF